MSTPRPDVRLRAHPSRRKPVCATIGGSAVSRAARSVPEVTTLVMPCELLVRWVLSSMLYMLVVAWFHESPPGPLSLNGAGEPA